MKTKQYNESFVKAGYNGHSTMIYQVDDKKFKFTYESGNAFERFKIEQYDGEKLNYIANILDLGVSRNTSAYMDTDIEMKNRVASLNEDARKYVKNLIS